jgi:hypothetical protein
MVTSPDVPLSQVKEPMELDALNALLAKAKSATPTRRIEWRDQIAGFGTPAIEGVKPWLSSPALAAFAIRVIERAASHGDSALAARVLRAAKAGVPPAVAPDLDWALQRLKAEAHAADPVAPTAPATQGVPPPPRATRSPLRRPAR